MGDTIPYYLDQLLSFLTSPWSLVALILGVVVIGFILNKPSARWWILSCLLYTTTFGVTTAVTGSETSQYGQAEVIQLAFPLNLIETNARALTVVCLILLLIPTVMSSRGRRSTLLSSGFAAFFTLEVWICIRLMFGSLATARSVLDAIVYTLMLLTLAIGAGRWLQDGADVRSLLKSIMGFAILFILGNVYQILAVPSTAAQGRLSGTTPNPQVVGQTAAFVIVPMLFLTQDKLSQRRLRLAAVAVGGAMIPLLLWSGSRSSMLMCVVGVVFVFGIKVYRFLLPAIGLLLVLWISSLLFPMAFAGVDRFLDTSNDRVVSWQGLWESFLQNPVVGTPSNGMGYAESCFLATLAYYGAIGGIPLFLAVIMTASSLFMIVRKRRMLEPGGNLSNLIAAQFAMILIVATFEAGLLGTLNISTIMLYLDFAMLAFCLDEIKQHDQSALHSYATGESEIGDDSAVPEFYMP